MNRVARVIHQNVPDFSEISKPHPRTNFLASKIGIALERQKDGIEIHNDIENHKLEDREGNHQPIKEFPLPVEPTDLSFLFRFRYHSRPFLKGLICPKKSRNIY